MSKTLDEAVALAPLVLQATCRVRSSSWVSVAGPPFADGWRGILAAHIRSLTTAALEFFMCRPTIPFLLPALRRRLFCCRHRLSDIVGVGRSSFMCIESLSVSFLLERYSAAESCKESQEESSSHSWEEASLPLSTFQPLMRTCLKEETSFPCL